MSAATASGSGPGAVDVPHLRALLRAVLDQAELPGREALLQQAEHARPRSGGPGSVTMVELTVDGADALRSEVDDGVLPLATVLDAAGAEVGEVLLWTTAGLLDTLEVAWWTDEAPVALPALGSVVPALPGAGPPA